MRDLVASFFFLLRQSLGRLLLKSFWRKNFAVSLSSVKARKMSTIEVELAVKQEPNEVDSIAEEEVRVKDTEVEDWVKQKLNELLDSTAGGGGSESRSREDLRQDGVIGGESNQSSREEQSHKEAPEPKQKDLSGLSTQEKRSLWVSGGGKQTSEKYKKPKYKDDRSFANSTSVQDVREAPKPIQKKRSALVSGRGKQTSKKYKKPKYEDDRSFANSTSVRDVRPFSGFVLFANGISLGECVTTEFLNRKQVQIEWENLSEELKDTYEFSAAMIRSSPFYHMYTTLERKISEGVGYSMTQNAKSELLQLQKNVSNFLISELQANLYNGHFALEWLFALEWGCYMHDDLWVIIAKFLKFI